MIKRIKTIAGILLAVSSPFSFWASSLSGNVSCRIDTEQGLVIPVGHKSDAYPLLLLLGIGQGAVAFFLIKKKAHRARDNESGFPPSTIPQFSSIPFFGEEDEDEAPDLQECDWIADFYAYPTILVWGGHGSGKSTFSEWLAGERVQDGHQLIALDPHAKYGQWMNLGVEPVGRGQDYGACEKALQLLIKETKKRYELRANTPNYNPKPLTILIEEFTQWSSHCDSAGDFFTVALSDFRKVGIHVIFVSHARTLSGLGGSKGMAQTRDNSLLELQLLSKPDKTQKGKATPQFKGFLKYPSESPISVEINPDWKPSNLTIRAETRSVRETSVSDRCETPNPLLDGVFPIVSLSSETGDFRAERRELEDALLMKQIERLRNEGKNQTQIIWELWQAKPGNSQAYKDALSEYKRLTGEDK